MKFKQGGATCFLFPIAMTIDPRLFLISKFLINSDFNEELEQYKEQTKRDGENLVRSVFPKRVSEMQELLNSKLFNVEPSNVLQVVNLPVPLLTEQNGFDTKPAFGTPVYTFPGGKISHNTRIKEMIETAKPCLTQLMMEAQIVRMWIQFNVPRIEDGNNFGVGIQEDVLAEVSGIERDALTFLDQFTSLAQVSHFKWPQYLHDVDSRVDAPAECELDVREATCNATLPPKVSVGKRFPKYYASRGKLVAKAAKYPHIDDYRECIRDMDEKQAISMRCIIMEIRNHYSVLHDLIEKNLDRIKVPRSNNTMSMY
ncbi:hypothetical protein ACTXT7_011905 [Hymenolepis weldensis]